jgi:signal transduction histidine kinase
VVVKLDAASRFSLARLITLFVVSISLLMGGISIFFVRYFSRITEDTLRSSYASESRAVADALAAQFFERYGDVQEVAVAERNVLHDQGLATDVLNGLVELYRVYDLSLVVDLKGRLIAANSVDWEGRALPVEKLKHVNFSHRPWFKAAIRSQFTEERRKELVGTYFEDVAEDPDVSLVYGEPREVTGFTALIRNPRGVPIAIASNRAGVRWIQRALDESYQKLRSSGLGRSLIILRDRSGRSLLQAGTNDLAPMLAQGNGAIGNTPVTGNKFVDKIGWNIVVFTPNSELSKNLQLSRLVHLVLLSIFVLLSVLISVFFGARLAQISRDLQQALSLKDRLESAVQERTQRLEQSLSQLTQTRDQMIAQEKMASLGVLSAGMAHELKNPLSVIMNAAGVSELIANSMPPEVHKQVTQLNACAGLIVKHCQRMDSTIRSILASARGENEPLVKTDMGALLQESLTLSLKSYELQHRFFAQTTTTVLTAKTEINAYPGQLNRVFLNAFENALYSLSKKAEAQPAGEFVPRIDVRVTRGGDFLSVEIEDNGIGMTEEVKSKMMQPFFTTKPAGEGTGLGLAISWNIIQKHEGEISIMTEAGKYCRFIYRIKANLGAKNRTEAA